MDLTDTDKAYLAGLFDGEGCVGYYPRHAKGVPYHSASLHLTSTDPRVISWLLGKVGCGKVSVKNPKDHRKTSYNWQLSNKTDIAEVLGAIRPYLIIKADQVDLLFSLWKAEEPLHKGRVTPELITLRQKAVDDIKHLKGLSYTVTMVEGVETRRAGSLQSGETKG